MKNNPQFYSRISNLTCINSTEIKTNSLRQQITIILVFVLLFVQNVSSFELFSNKIADVMPQINGHTSFGDLNGDGFNDIFSSGLYSYDCLNCGPFPPWYEPIIIDEPAKIFLNNKKGGFYEIESNFGETNLDALVAGWQDRINVYRSTIADINNDGFNDIVASDGRIFINNGSAQFDVSILLEIGVSRTPIYTIDFDNDGILEIFNAGKIRKRTSLDPIGYQTDNSFNLATSLDVKFADFDGDTYIDIVTYGNNSNIIIYLNDQAGNFSTLNKVEIYDVENISLVVGDVDGDTMVDIVLSDKSILKNLGQLNFQKIENSIILDGIISDSEIVSINYTVIKLIKYNQDEYPDLLVKVYGDNNFESAYYILLNDGHGGYKVSENLFTSVLGAEYAGGALSADFNNDGYEDFLVNNTRGYNYIFSYSSSEEYQRLKIDPVVFMNANLQITNPQTGTTSPSIDTRALFSDFVNFDINNDGTDEYLSTDSNNQFLNTNFYKPYSETHGDWGYKPFYLSEINVNGYKVNNIELFDDEVRAYRETIKGDLNNDGLDDLLVSFVECDILCNTPKVRVFYNSENGLIEENSQDYELDFDGRGKVVDLDGNGTNEIVQFYSEGDYPNYVREMRIIELEINNNQFNITELRLDDSGSQFSLQDINNDKIADIIYLSKDRLMVVFGDDEISSLASPVELIEDDTVSYKFYDFDDDGDMDLYINTNYSIRIYRFMNNGDGEFYARKLFSFPMAINLFNVVFADFNNDGIVEVVNSDEYYYPGIFIYRLYSNSIYKEVYTNNTWSIFNYPLASRPLIDDFDNDGKLDVLFNGSIIFSRDFKFFSGLNYDPNHSGHGFSIENVGNDQFYTVFYTYGSDKYPEWYADLGLFEEPREDYWNIADNEMGVVKYEYDYDNQTAVQITDSEYKGYLAHNKCSDTYGDINLSYGIGEGYPGESGEWCSKPIVGYYQRPENNLSGLWWAGGEDSGWGWSVALVERENTTEMVVILYYYDGEGNPRWLIGQQTGFEIGHEITLDMKMVKGYPRSSTPTDLEFIPAGTISITLNQASHNLSTAGSMSVDVTYPGLEGGHWVRDNIPIALFSTAR